MSSSALSVAQKKADIGIRKDPNATKRPFIGLQKSVLVSIPPQLNFKPAFTPNQTYSASSIFNLCQKILYDWFPTTNFTREAAPGTLLINNQNLGNFDLAVVPGLTLDNTDVNATTLFTPRQDTASSWIIVKGNLVIGSGITLTPSTRKLFTVVYVTGNLTMNGNAQISMTQRGANHSGVSPDSGGFTAPVDIQVGTNTLISGIGAAGALPRSEMDGPGANQGQDGSTIQNLLQSGGGGGGYWDLDLSAPGQVGSGGNGTCFSGGSGSGGTYDVFNSPGGITTLNAGENGGKGSDSVLYNVTDDSAAGSGNPNGSSLSDVTFDGTGGSLIVFVQGTITTNAFDQKHFTANGQLGRQMRSAATTGGGRVNSFGGATGGGVVIVVNDGASSLSQNIEALGGEYPSLASPDGRGNFKSGGNGAAVAYTFSQL